MTSVVASRMKDLVSRRNPVFRFIVLKSQKPQSPIVNPMSNPYGSVTRNTCPSRPFKSTVLQPTMSFAGAIMLPSDPPVVCAAMRMFGAMPSNSAAFC